MLPPQPPACWRSVLRRTLRKGRLCGQLECVPPPAHPDSSRSVRTGVCAGVCVAERPTPVGLLSSRVTLSWPWAFSSLPPPDLVPAMPSALLCPRTRTLARPLSPRLSSTLTGFSLRCPPASSAGELPFGVQPLYLCQLTRNVPYCMGETAFSAVLGWGLHCCLRPQPGGKSTGATARRRGECSPEGLTHETGMARGPEIESAFDSTSDGRILIPFVYLLMMVSSLRYMFSSGTSAPYFPTILVWLASFPVDWK